MKVWGYQYHGRRIMPTKALAISGIVVLGFIFFINWWLSPRPIENTLSQTEQIKILSELRKRYADDCECTDRGNAWHCREMKTSRVFIIKK